MVWRVDFETSNLTGQRRRYREAPKMGGSSGGGKGSFASQAKGGSTPSGGGGNTKPHSPEDKNQSQNNNQTDKGGLARSEKNANPQGLASKGVDKGLEQVAKKGAGTVVGEGANLAHAAKRAKDEGAGAGAQAAETAAAGIRAGASATGVGGAVVKGYDAVKKAASVVGVNIKDRYVVYLLLFGVFLALLPIVIFFIVVFFAWDNPRAVLSLGWDGFKAAAGAAIGAIFSYGGASKLAYEVDVKPGLPTAVAATAIAAKPAEGTYEYKLSMIDWEKSKYQTLPADNRCEVKTKVVKSTIDGKERSVIDSIQLKTNPGKELEGVARANCINTNYPLFQTVMRSQFIRDGLNQSLSVRFAYAEPTDSATLKKPASEIGQALRDKTLKRIWNRGNVPTAAQPSDAASPADLANEAQAALGFGRGVSKYTNNSYGQTVLDCANNYIPKPIQGTAGSNYFRLIDKMNHDLVCGINPKDLQLYYNYQDEAVVNGTDPVKAYSVKQESALVVCDMYSYLLAPSTDQAAPGPNGQLNNYTPSQTAVQNYRDRIKNRIDSAAIAGWQAVTYADTNHARFLNINELNKDFYKIAGMQAGQEYNYALDGRKSGVALEPDAISRIIGYYNQDAIANPGIQKDAPFQIALQSVFDSVTQNKGFFGSLLGGVLPSFSNSVCDAAYRRGAYTNNDAQAKAVVEKFYSTSYNSFKLAMAGIDYYSRPEKSTSISQIYKNIEYQDINFRLIRLESNAATAGTEDGPQNFNRMNFGMKAYMNAASISTGGKFLTENEAVARDDNIQVAQQYELQTRGLAYRLFNTDNPSSLTSRLRVAMTDKPQKVVGNIGSVMASIINPIRNLAGEKGTMTALLTGKSRVAEAASVYDSQNLKLDPAGIPEFFNQIDPIQNARFIEGLKKNNPTAAAKFTNWDQCFKEFIPSRFHLLSPPSDKVALYRDYCQPLLDIVSVDGKTVPPRSKIDSLETRYAAYHFYNLQADALVYLSNPDKEDASLDAISSQQAAGGTTPTAAPGGGGTAPPGSPGDTSTQQCPPGTADAGVGTKYGVGKVPQYNIRLCKVNSTTVNVTIAANLLKLFNDAKAAGVTMSGGGYRTYDEQVTLRTTNGCPNVYTAPASSCRTPTARPGESNHESGEAVDFTQNGSTLRGGSSGFNWMKANAARYFFFNLPSETWHWSKDGK